MWIDSDALYVTTGSAFSRRGLAGRAVGGGRGMLEAPAQLVAREDGRAQPGEVRVAADVVGVHVRVDQEADRLVGDAADRGDQLVGERRELRVDQQDAVGARRAR